MGKEYRLLHKKKKHRQDLFIATLAVVSVFDHLMYKRVHSAYLLRSIDGIFLPFQRQNCT